MGSKRNTVSDRKNNASSLINRRSQSGTQRPADVLYQKYKVSVKGRSYEVVLHADTEDGGFWVECLSLPGCDSQGDTVEETLEMVKDAIKGHLEVAAERKKKRVVA